MLASTRRDRLYRGRRVRAKGALAREGLLTRSRRKSSSSCKPVSNFDCLQTGPTLSTPESLLYPVSREGELTLGLVVRGISPSLLASLALRRAFDRNGRRASRAS